MLRKKFIVSIIVVAALSLVIYLPQKQDCSPFGSNDVTETVYQV